MNQERYIVFSIGDDDIRVDVLDRETLLLFLDEVRKSDDEKQETSNFLAHEQLLSDPLMGRWNADYLIIKGGQVVVPRPVEIVTQYDID